MTSPNLNKIQNLINSKKTGENDDENGENDHDRKRRREEREAVKEKGNAVAFLIIHNSHHERANEIGRLEAENQTYERDIGCLKETERNLLDEIKEIPTVD